MNQPANMSENTLATCLGAAAERSDIERFLRPAGLFSLGEACIRGEVSPHGIEDVITSMIREGKLPLALGPRSVLTVLRSMFGNPQRGEGAFEVAQRHYDLGNDLFERMLDKSMSYTCGYWKESSDLESAQRAKLDILCRKLKLEPGMRVLDIGCGWGNFAHHAASAYGVSVVGLTVSKEQAGFARNRCAGLPVEIRLESYERFRGSFDRVVSIEMIEAVGRRNLPCYFEMIHECLKPGGLAAIQVISADSFNLKSNRAINQFVMWLLVHIFPNGYLPTMDELMAARRAGLIVEDLENIASDYEKTLRAWRSNFEAGWPAIRSHYGDPFYRMWLYYLGGCIAVFQLRLAQVFQVVYSKGGTAGRYDRV